MKAIEISSKTDKSGRLKIDYKLDKAERKVRVIILFDDDNAEEDEERLWMYSVSNNPAFEFLQDPEEDVYSINDGEPLND
jgi:hypothetical protein